MDIKFQIPGANDFLTAVLGVTVVMATLALIAVFILMISKIVRAVEAKALKATPAAAPQSPAPVAAADGVNNGEVDLIGVDEKTAAVVMAIVSQQSEIPLNRLQFKSIKLVENNEKGGKAK